MWFYTLHRPHQHFPNPGCKGPRNNFLTAELHFVFLLHSSFPFPVSFSSPFSPSLSVDVYVCACMKANNRMYMTKDYTSSSSFIVTFCSLASFESTAASVNEIPVFRMFLPRLTGWQHMFGNRGTNELKINVVPSVMQPTLLHAFQSLFFSLYPPLCRWKRERHHYTLNCDVVYVVKVSSVYNFFLFSAKSNPHNILKRTQ